MMELDVIITRVHRAMRVNMRGWNRSETPPRASHCLVCVLDGRAEYVFVDCGKRYDVRAGDIFLLPEGSRYTGRQVGDTDYQCMYVDFTVLDPAEYARLPIPDVCHPAHGEQARAQFERMVRAWTAKRETYFLECKQLLLGLLLHLIEECGGQDERRRVLVRLQPAIKYLYAHYCEPDTRLSELPRLCFLSDSQFRRLFRVAFQKTARAYLIDLRIAHARDLLEDERLRSVSVRSVAEQCGFQDIFYFSRAFKYRAGMSPSKYREAQILQDDR